MRNRLPSHCWDTDSGTKFPEPGTRHSDRDMKIKGDLPAPDGRAPRIRTVWQLDTGEIAPRLITAYPLAA